MGRPTGESDSLVGETQREINSILSITEHVEFGKNTGGPPSKPKYYLMTDREAVL